MTIRTTAPWAPLRPAVLAVAAAVALLGCTGQRLNQLSNQASARFLNQPLAQAVNELGAPQRQRPIADLREYTWSTGVPGDRGGDCTLSLIADRRGVVVDYRMDGTPLGCDRLLGKA